MNNNIEKLAELFKAFPGIGSRQAKRFVFFILASGGNYAEKLAKEILEIKKGIRNCAMCYRYFEGSEDREFCSRCVNPKIDKSLILIVEKDSDLEAIERSHTYNGLFFVLGSLIPIAEKETLMRARINELREKIEKSIPTEIIFAFSANPQGEHTDTYLREIFRSFTETHKIKMTTLGRGLSTGTELEYSDKDTIKNALQGRK